MPARRRDVLFPEATSKSARPSRFTMATWVPSGVMCGTHRSGELKPNSPVSAARSAGVVPSHGSTLLVPIQANHRAAGSSPRRRMRSRRGSVRDQRKERTSPTQVRRTGSGSPGTGCHVPQSRAPSAPRITPAATRASIQYPPGVLLCSIGSPPHPAAPGLFVHYIIFRPRWGCRGSGRMLKRAISQSACLDALFVSMIQ